MITNADDDRLEEIARRLGRVRWWPWHAQGFEVVGPVWRYSDGGVCELPGEAEFIGNAPSDMEFLLELIGRIANESA